MSRRDLFAVYSIVVLGCTATQAAPPAAISKPISGVPRASGGSNSISYFQGADAAPQGTPCTVTLFSNYLFENFNAQYFTYTPACPGPWSSIQFVGNFAITPGIQYDRTAEISIGYVNVYFGTTREDDPTFGPTWKVTRDLTDYAPLFNTTQPGEVDLGNLVNSEYTGVISGTATLEFYPVASGATAPVVADAVYPLPDGPGGAVALNNSSSQLAETFTLPTNVERAYLDVFTQSQSNDEFWWSCVPNDILSDFPGDCGNSAFREAEISIDGTPAGVAPVYPWIYTGGVDPNLWLPIPDVQTLNFKPYRVDLTPFAATLSNGQPHTVALSVYNADSYFAATATLLVYEDHGSTTVTGATTENTIGSGPNPVEQENIGINSSGYPVGTIAITSDRQFTVSGYVKTSHGTITTVISQTIDYGNLQTYTNSLNEYQQLTTVNSITTVTDGSNTENTTRDYTFPFNVTITAVTASNGDFDETVSDKQSYNLAVLVQSDGVTTSSGSTSDSFSGADTIDYTAGVDLGQESTEIQKTKTGNTCNELQFKALNDTLIGYTAGPCQ
ncbi:peptide-N4-asparagine amidase [Nevskia soli]|uniref:peptide-N4-asparagine amidase n=1 Tax=Nevskia soli TaxID=418856 RepID=UPI0015D74386|nr:peptide-N4-asparagine amidase [Nevskia soli]